MSATNLAPPGDLTRSFEALTPPVHKSFRWLTALAVLALGVAAWFGPGLIHPTLQADAFGAGATVPQGTPVTLSVADLDVSALAGVTITRVGPVGDAQLLGAWVLSASQQDAYDQATLAWSNACLSSDGGLIGTGPMCQVPPGDGQAQTYLNYWVQLGAPLDATTALPQHVDDGQPATLVTLWTAESCPDYLANSVVVHTRRFGLPGIAKVSIGQLPGCWGR